MRARSLKAYLSKAMLDKLIRNISDDSDGIDTAYLQQLIGELKTASGQERHAVVNRQLSELSDMLTQLANFQDTKLSPATPEVQAMVSKNVQNLTEALFEADVDSFLLAQGGLLVIYGSILFYDPRSLDMDLNVVSATKLNGDYAVAERAPAVVRLAEGLDIFNSKHSWYRISLKVQGETYTEPLGEGSTLDESYVSFYSIDELEHQLQVQSQKSGDESYELDMAFWSALLKTNILLSGRILCREDLIPQANELKKKLLERLYGLMRYYDFYRLAVMLSIKRDLQIRIGRRV